jgi:integrase
MMTLIAEFCAVAGQRHEDVLRLLLPKEDDAVICVDPLKTKYDEAQVTTETPFTEGLRDIIARARELRNTPASGKKPTAVVLGRHLFCNRKGQPYTDSGFKTMWNPLQVRLDGQGGERFTFHDLRGYYVSEAKARGWQVKDTTGHKDEKTADRIYDRRRVRKARPLK